MNGRFRLIWVIIAAIVMSSYGSPAEAKSRTIRKVFESWTNSVEAVARQTKAVGAPSKPPAQLSPPSVHGASEAIGDPAAKLGMAEGGENRRNIGLGVTDLAARDGREQEEVAPAAAPLANKEFTGQPVGRANPEPDYLPFIAIAFVLAVVGLVWLSASLARFTVGEKATPRSNAALTKPVRPSRVAAFDRKKALQATVAWLAKCGRVTAHFAGRILLLIAIYVGLSALNPIFCAIAFAPFGGGPRWIPFLPEGLLLAYIIFKTRTKAARSGGSPVSPPAAQLVSPAV
jgi:hypothetical protein